MKRTAAKKYIIEISCIANETYWSVPEKLLLQTLDLSPSQAGDLIRKCKKAKISCSDDAQIELAENMEDMASWEEDWEDYKQHVRDLVGI